MNSERLSLQGSTWIPPTLYKNPFPKDNNPARTVPGRNSGSAAASPSCRSLLSAFDIKVKSKKPGEEKVPWKISAPLPCKHTDWALEFKSKEGGTKTGVRRKSKSRVYVLLLPWAESRHISFYCTSLLLCFVDIAFFLQTEDKTLHQRKDRDLLKLRWWLASLAIKYILIKVCTFFRRTARAHLVDYSRV